MSYCEDYIDPFERECDHGRRDGMRCVECTLDALDERVDDDEDWECAYPDKCLMPSPLHHRSECYTVEDAEAYYAEVEGVTFPTSKT
jgi:hypothetical protein